LPVQVFAVTLIRFFLEPLGHFGTTFSETFRNMFSKLPLQLWIPAFIFLTLLMIVVVMLFAGKVFSTCLVLPYLSVFWSLICGEDALSWMTFAS